jgi:hypothetical protein
MKKVLGLFLAVAIVTSVVPYARSLGTPTPPSGISAEDWIPVGDAAGFVVARGNLPPGLTTTTPGTLKGYFMVRRGTAWFRVDSAPDYGAQKTMMAR